MIVPFLAAAASSNASQDPVQADIAFTAGAALTLDAAGGIQAAADRSGKSNAAGQDLSTRRMTLDDGSGSGAAGLQTAYAVGDRCVRTVGGSGVRCIALMWVPRSPRVLMAGPAASGSLPAYRIRIT